MDDSPGPWDLDAANRVLADRFAAWVRRLDLTVVAIDGEGASLRMPFSDELCRDGGIVSGQAIAALADTAMVIAIASVSNGYRPMATIDLHTTFMRPVSNADVVARAEVQRIGRTMAFARVTMHAVARGADGPADGVDRPAIVASAVGTFAVS